MNKTRISLSENLSPLIELAAKLPFKQRGLWFFGFLYVALSSFTALINIYDPSEEELVRHLDSFMVAISGLGLGTKIFLLVGFLVLLLSFLVVALWAEGALVRGTILARTKAMSIKEVGKMDRQTLWNLCLFNFFIPIFAIFVIAVIVFFGFWGVSLLPELPQAIIGLLLVFALVVFLLVLGAYLVALWPMALRCLLAGNKPLASLRLASDLIRANFWPTLFYNIVIGIISGTLYMFALIPAAIFMVIAVIFYGQSQVLLITFSLITLFFLVAYLILAGYIETASQTAKTGWWKELKKIK